MAFFLNRIQAHSWTRCTDYKAAITGGDYDEDECEGWIRGWEFDGITFGADRGINYQVGVGGGQSLCQSALSGTASNDYGLRSGKTTQYVSGSTVRMVWPAKNHANYECMANIPDTAMKLYMNPNVNPTSDLPNTASTMTGNGYELVADFQDGCNAGSDGCGFQNCPKFCENTDKATCFGDFVVPTVDTSGYYTFVWYWIFNPGSPYISCFEAYVEADGTVTTPDDTETGTNPDGTIANYLTQIPVCITGQTYSATAVSTFTRAQFTSVVDSDSDVYILSNAPDANGFDFTVQVKHTSPGADVTAIATDSFCADYETEYGSSVSCDISDACGEIVTFALYDNTDGTPSPTTPGSSPSTPSPVTVNSDAIKVINDQSTQAYYLSFVLDNVDDCAMNIQSVQIESSGAYRDNDQYYYDGGHKYAFDYDQLTSFDAMLPISLRIVLSSGEAIVLTDIITDLTGGNVFTSSKTCDGSETNTDTPAPTVPGQTPMPTMNAQNPVPTQSPSEQPSVQSPAPTIADGDIADTTSDDTTPDLGNPSGASHYGGYAAAACALVLFCMF
jgi:hypothetical protein